MLLTYIMPADINKSHSQENPHIIPVKIKHNPHSPISTLKPRLILFQTDNVISEKFPKEIPIHPDAQISPLLLPSTTTPSTSKNPTPISNFTPKYPLISCPQYSRALPYTSRTTRSITNITQKFIRTTNIASQKSQSSLSLT